MSFISCILVSDVQYRVQPTSFFLKKKLSEWAGRTCRPKFDWDFQNFRNCDSKFYKMGRKYHLTPVKLTWFAVTERLFSTSWVSNWAGKTLNTWTSWVSNWGGKTLNTWTSWVSNAGKTLNVWISRVSCCARKTRMIRITRFFFGKIGNRVPDLPNLSVIM